MTLSLAERATLRLSHRKVEQRSKGYTDFCLDCECDWPCPTIRLLDALEDAETQLAEMRAKP